MAQIRTAIELGEHEARVLQVRVAKKGRPQVKAAARIPLPARGQMEAKAVSKARAEALRDGLRSAGLKVASATVVIPKRNATVRYVVLPSTDENEIGRMARFEAERHIPFNAQRHVISHCVMQKDQLQGSHVLLAAVDSPDLEEIKELAAVAGFDIEAVDVSSLAQFNMLSTLASDGREKTIGYLHVGQHSSDITIASNNMLIFTRSVPYGLDRLTADLQEVAAEGAKFQIGDLKSIDLLHPTEGLRRLGLIPQVEEVADDLELGHEQTKTSNTRDAAGVLRDWLNRLSVEIQRSYEFARRELDCAPITTIVVAGEVANWPNFSTYIQAGFSVASVALNALDGLEDPHNVLRQPQSFVAAAGALAKHWRPKALSVNLTPPDYRRQGAIRRRRQSLLVTAGLALVVLVSGYFLLRQVNALRAEQLRAYKNANSKLRVIAEGLLDKEKQLGIINRFRYDKRSALAILDTISAFDYMPRRVCIDQFDYVRNGTVVIRGYALTMPDLNKFLMDLGQATYQDEKIFPGGVRQTGLEMNKPLDGRTEQVILFTVTGYPE